MRRLGRWLLNTLTVLSLLLFIATAALWFNCRNGPHWYRHGPQGGRRFILGGTPRVVSFTWLEPLPPAIRGQPPAVIAQWQRPKLFQHEGRWGGSVIVSPVVTRSSPLSRGPSPVIGTGYALFTPYGWLLAAMMVLPAGRLTARLLRRRQPGEGCCTTCGYNLTGNTSGVCPECGRKVNP